MMGSGGSGTSGGGTNIGGTKPITATGAPRRTQEQRFRDDAAQAMVRQQQQRGRNPVGGMNLTAEERSMRRAPERGLSPGDVLATVGSSGYGQVASAKLAGRTDISVQQLGNLASRANIGQLPEMRVGGVVVPNVSTNVLNVFGRQRATGILDRLIAGGTPVTKDGFIQGVTSQDGSYFGRSDTAPNQTLLSGQSQGRDDVSPEITPEVTPERDEEPIITNPVLGRGERGRRRTKSSRAGGAGFVEEGSGILLSSAKNTYGG
tara:strand:- start:4240 stop:5025 length:786 start_codon:yes stop_codon:yes gene_type:complete